MADANKTAVRVLKETAAGTIQTNPAFRNLRYTSESLSFTPQTETSNEIDSTRQVNDLILTGFETGGDVGMELSFGNSADILEGVMFNSWYRTPEVANGLDFTGVSTATLGAANVVSITLGTTVTLAASKTIAGLGTSASMVANTAFKVGHLVVLENFATASNNRTPKVLTSVTATTLVSTGAGWTNEATAPAGSASSRGARVKVVGFQATTGDVNATAAPNALTSTTLDFSTLGLVVGMWIKLYGFTTTATSNNGWARVSSIAANTLTFDIVPTGWSAKTEAGTVGGYFGDFLKNGVTDVTYSVEVEYSLSAPTYMYYRGNKPSTYTLQADTQQIVTESVTFVGFNALDPTTTRGVSNFRGDAVAMGTPATVDAQGYSVMDSSNAVPFVIAGGAEMAGPNFVNSFSIQLENNLRPQTAVGTLGAVGIGAGRVNITGNLNTYFGDTTELAKLTSNTATGFAVGFLDSAFNKGMIYDLPKIKYSGGQPDVTGIDTDIFLDLQFQALRDLAGGRDYTILIQNFDYVA